MLQRIFRTFLLIAILFLIVISGRFTSAQYERPRASTQELQWRDGDIVFQGGVSAQCRAIEQATGSSWTHCGIVFTDKKGPYVIEAVQPVRRTALKEWLRRGNGVFSVKRLSNEEVLSPAVIQKMKEVAKEYIGRDYDAYFMWDDDRIYCSELVWKIYKRGAEIEVGEVERFGDMDLSGPDAQRILKERFGDKYPADEPVVTPASIHRSEALRTVHEGSALAN